jgi:hypothetical protein
MGMGSPGETLDTKGEALMKTTFQLCVSLGRRYFFEIATFIAISITASVWTMLDLDSLPANALASLEILGIFWITTRVLLSESIFRTHGEWKARPVSRREMMQSQILCLALVFAFPFALRIFTIQQVLAPDASGWSYLITHRWSWAILSYGILVAILCLGNRAMSRAPGRPVAGWIFIGIVAMCLLMTGLSSSKSPLTSFHVGHGDSGIGEGRTLSMSVRSLLPADADLIGQWLPQQKWQNDEPGARLLIRIPLTSQSTTKSEGTSLRILWQKEHGRRLKLRAELVFCSGVVNSFRARYNYLPVVRYGDGSFAPIAAIRADSDSLALPLLPIDRYYIDGEFTSPLILPENTLTWDKLIEGAELMIFVRDRGGIPVEGQNPYENPMSIGEREMTIAPPAKGDLEASVHYLVDQANINGSSAGVLNLLGSEAVPAVIARNPFTDRAWKSILPFLQKHANESHKPALLDFLKLDPRAADIFLGKGWFNDALLIIKDHLIEGRIPSPDVFLELAKLRDPNLGAPLQREFLRLTSRVEEIGNLLRDHPNVDWNALIKEGWHRRKYNIGTDAEWWIFANWAAQKGDTSALDRLTQEAARGSRREQKFLTELIGHLVPSDTPLISWLRKNRSSINFDNGFKQK